MKKIFLLFVWVISLFASSVKIVTIENILPNNNAKRMAVIELGAAGYNYFIIKVDKQGHWDLIKAKWGISLIREGLIPFSDIKTQFYKDLRAISQYGVKPQNIHFVISSGALSTPNGIKIAKAFRKLGFIVNEITPRQEAIYGFIVAVPDKFRNNSFFVDIGSGNTKIAWIENGKFKTISTYGAKYYLSNISNEQVFNTVNKLSSQIPVQNRQFCFIIGGVPYKLAKKVRLNKKEIYTPLLLPNEYKSLIDSNNLKIMSGLNIYNAIYEATNTKIFIFPWKADFAIGFLIALEKNR